MEVNIFQCTLENESSSRLFVCLCVLGFLNCPVEVSDVCWCVLSDIRFRLRPSECVWGMSQTDLWSLPPARERQLVARGVSAVLGVSAAPHHELLLQRSQTLLQTRLPTVRADSFIHSFFSSVARHCSCRRGVCAFNNPNPLKRGRVCLFKGNISKQIFMHFCFTSFPTRILWIGYCL